MYAKVTIVGNLGQDPETKYTQSGKMNVNFSVATNRRYTDSNGQPVDKTTWFRVTAWARLAETLDKLAQDGHLTKGRQVLVTGRIETNEFVGRDGEKRMSLEVMADEVLLVGGRGGEGGGGTGNFNRQADPAPVAEDIDDLPF